MHHCKIFTVSLLLAFLSVGTASGDQERNGDETLAKEVEKSLPDAQAFAEKLRKAIEAANGGAETFRKQVDASLTRLNDHFGRQAFEPSDTPPDFDLDRLLEKTVPAVAGAIHPESGAGGLPPLMVMVGLSMPDDSLEALLRDVSAVGGQVVLRGFHDGSLPATAARLGSFVDNDNRGGVSIDPRLFETFNIKAVPVFIVPAGPLGDCNTPGCSPAAPPHDRISGNISLRYALETLSGNGDHKAIAANWLKRLDGGQ